MTHALDLRKCLGEIRKASPVVQCITNEVAMNFSANVLNSVGASPVMAYAPQEAAEFTKIADALTINIGTLTGERYSGMLSAMKCASESRKPVVFDPVAHFASQFRRDATRDLLSFNPAIVRANASEIIAFTDKTSAKGVDSRDPVETAYTAAIHLSRIKNTVVAMSGSTDFITDGESHWALKGGHPLMSKTSATGCALTCLTGAFIAIMPDNALQSAIGAMALFAAAGKLAGDKAAGPGTFVPLFIDALAKIDDYDISNVVEICQWRP
ncbi:hydroxyethylthiazole kinase [Bartonella sp. LJL80]